MSKDVLKRWNESDRGDALEAVLACCGSRAWAAAMIQGRPYRGEEELRLAADRLWWSLNTEDWLEAFACHPRIGQRAVTHALGDFAKWSQQEQAQVAGTGEEVQRALAEGNRSYEATFGFTYIVCATGRCAEEMLDILNQRLRNDAATEIREAAEQQRQITQIRLGKWLHG